MAPWPAREPTATASMCRQPENSFPWPRPRGIVARSVRMARSHAGEVFLQSNRHVDRGVHWLWGAGIPRVESVPMGVCNAGEAHCRSSEPSPSMGDTARFQSAMHMCVRFETMAPCVAGPTHGCLLNWVRLPSVASSASMSISCMPVRCVWMAGSRAGDGTRMDKPTRHPERDLLTLPLEMSTAVRFAKTVPFNAGVGTRKPRRLLRKGDSPSWTRSTEAPALAGSMVNSPAGETISRILSCAALCAYRSSTSTSVRVAASARWIAMATRSAPTTTSRCCRHPGVTSISAWGRAVAAA